MKGTEKQVSWATEILSGFAGTEQKDLVAAFREAGQEKVAAAGIAGPQDIADFIANSEVRLRADVGDELTTAQIKRAKRALCGIAGCTCSGDAGERGPQDGFELLPSLQGMLRVVSTARGPGNPGVVHGETQKRRNITLSDRLAEKARQIGGGNISEGIRKALDEYT